MPTFGIAYYGNLYLVTDVRYCYLRSIALRAVSSESHHRKAVIKLPKSFEAYHLALLPGIHPKVMARGTRKISVFSVPDFLERPCGNSNQPPPSDPIFSWEFRDEVMARVSEPSIHSNGDVYLTIATSRGYCLFHMSGDLISVSKLVGHASDHGDSVALGTHRAFRMTPRLADGGCTAVSFRGGPGGATTKEHRQPEKEWGRFFAMDEWSGRSVGELSNGDIIVHEFSP
ncbi:hypothetical protein ONZ45_g1091 [Pleurotus djamor]|nr:hypothetical protein ONZ45_g1091 [Pleurotus djamor]